MKKWYKPELAELNIKRTTYNGKPEDKPDYGLYDINGNPIGEKTYGPSSSTSAHAEVH